MKKFSLIFCALLLLFLVGCSKKVTVTFVTNGADAIAPVELKEGSNLELTNVTKTGYKFDGWFLDSEFTNEFKDTVVKEDITLYAKWSILKFTVKFKSYNDTQIGPDQNIEYGKGATAPANPTRVGYTFDRWDKAFNDIKEDTIVTGIFSVTKFTVKFVDHDGTQIGTDQSIEYGKGATAPANPTRVGYDFNKWDIDFSNVKNNLVVKATYNLHFYTIKYYDGETMVTHTPNSYNITSTVMLSTSEKTNLIFAGWYTDSGFAEGTLMTEIRPGKTGDIILYGKWLDETQKHNINYELNGGSWTWTIANIAEPGKGINQYSNLPEIFMQDFYKYLKDNNLLTSSLVATSLQKRTWAEFSTLGGDPYASYNHTSSETSKTNDGYSQFFYDSATGNTTTNEVLTITGGFLGTEPYKTKYANLVQHVSKLLSLKYTSNYFWEGASSKPLAGFVLDGYFYGTQGAGTGDFAALRSVAPNTNVLYKFVSTTLTKVDTVYQLNSYTKGLSAKLVDPVKEGYVFGGWYDNVELSGQAISLIASNTNPALKYYAKWIAIA
jgi:uncharacterized repeat protein (TIGR02543 family)